MKKLKIKLLSKCDSKLQVVKLIKDCTGLGLKQAKDLADEMFNCVGLVKEIELKEPYLNSNGILFNPFEEFTNKIKTFGDFQVSGGISWERDLKMLSLGVADTEDYVNFVSEYMTLNNTEENKKILDVLFNKLQKQDLIDLVNQIKI